MSEENADLLKRAVDAYNRRDAEALLEDLDPHANLAEIRNGKGIRIRGYLDPEAAIDAAALTG